jgi:hypothetical protein
MSTKQDRRKTARKPSRKVKTTGKGTKPAVRALDAKLEALSKDEQFRAALDRFLVVYELRNLPAGSVVDEPALTKLLSKWEQGCPMTRAERQTLEELGVLRLDSGPEPPEVGEPLTNTATLQLAADVEALLAFAVRLRTAAESRLHKPLPAGLEDPEVFYGAVAAVVPELVHATHLLVEFLNLDCADDPRTAAQIKACRRRSTSWPGLYFMHAGAQKQQAEAQMQLGQDLFFRINEGKLRGGKPGQLSSYRQAALQVLACVYENVPQFARLPSGGCDGTKENPLRRLVRLNKHDDLCDFVAVMLFAPDKVRQKHIRTMQQRCEGWTCPAQLAPRDYWRKQFAGRQWGDVADHVRRGVVQYSKRLDLTALAPELAARPR